MTYDTLFDEFVLCFPDDAPRIQEIAKCADAEPSDGMHIMFGMVIVPYLVELLEKGNVEKVKSVFVFFERMAEADDTMISEVLEFTVLEELISRGKQILDICKKFMGQKTLERCSILEKYVL